MRKLRYIVVGTSFAALTGCSVSNEFPTEIRGDWYTEYSCEPISISTNDVSGKIWYQVAGAQKDAGKTADTDADATEEEKLTAEVGKIEANIRNLEGEIPSWRQQDFNLKAKATQKEIQTNGDQKIVQMDGLFVNGEGCKGTATLGQDSLVFALQKNAELEGTAKPQQSLCSDSFTLQSKKPENCASPVERANTELAALNSKLSETKENLRVLRNTPGSRAVADSYPHPCDDLDPKMHTEIVGTEGQCAPKHILRLTQAGWMVQQFPGVPKTFSSNNELSHLLEPNKAAKESTGISDEKRETSAAKVKRQVFLDETGPKTCAAKYADNKLQFSCDMPMNGIYTTGTADFKRSQKCKDDNPKDCKPPTFSVTGVKNWSLSKNISSKQKASAEELTKNLKNAKAYYVFKVTKAFRKVYVDGTKKIEKDSGYIMKTKPGLLAYETESGPLVLYTAAISGLHRSDGKVFSVDCNKKGLCQIELVADKDEDGVADNKDCDPESAQLGEKALDNDCDGVVNKEDCDPNGHTDDLDCDGVATSVDCDDTDSTNKSAKNTDTDCDGIVNAKDCDPEDSENSSVSCVVPFAREFEQFCEDFNNASNEIKQGQIVKKAKDVSKAATISNARGKLTSIDASREADSLSIDVAVGDDKEYVFTVESLFSAIRSGTEIFDTVTNMEEGDCVIFSASEFDSTAIAQSSEVCEGLFGGRKFFAKFTSVKPCPDI